MNNLLPGLKGGGKTSDSDLRAKVDLLDPPEIAPKKTTAAPCPEETNAILTLLKPLVIRASKIQAEQEGQPGITVKDYCPFTVEGAPYGTLLSVEVETDKNQFRHYSSYEEIEDDFSSRRVSSGTLTTAVSRVMDQLLRYYGENPAWRKVEKLAYPDNEKE